MFICALFNQKYINCRQGAQFDQLGFTIYINNRIVILASLASSDRPSGACYMYNRIRTLTSSNCLHSDVSGIKVGFCAGSGIKWSGAPEH